MEVHSLSLLLKRVILSNAKKKTIVHILKLVDNVINWISNNLPIYEIGGICSEVKIQEAAPYGSD